MIASIVLISCLAAVELLALLRVAYNVWRKYRDPSDSAKDEKKEKNKSIR